MMRRLAIVGVVAAAWLAVTVLPTLGNDTGTVNATVATPSPCMTLDQSAVDFGTHPFGTDSSIVSWQQVAVQDCSSLDQSLMISGTDASSTTSGASWALSAQANPCLVGPNVYRMAASHPADSVAASLNHQVYDALGHVPADGSGIIDLGLVMPCEGSDGQGETMTFDINFLVTIP